MGWIGVNLSFSVKSFAYRWNKLQEDSPEILIELWIAREKLSKSGAVGHVKNLSDASASLKTWSQYCLDIGSQKDVVNRWLLAFREGRKKITEGGEEKRELLNTSPATHLRIEKNFRVGRLRPNHK